MYTLLEKEKQYGIRVGETCVPDISTDRERVLALLKLMEENDMDEEHVYDVIEDWFGREVDM